MSSRLSPALSEFAEGRWPDQRMEPPLHPSEREQYEDEFDRFEAGRWSPGRRVAAALARFMIVFGVGVAATLIWQSYGNMGRRMIASLSPELGWLAPPLPLPPPAPAPAVSASPDQFAALARSLAGVRQSVDRLAADITKLQAARQDPPPAASTTAVTPGRKSAASSSR